MRPIVRPKRRGIAILYTMLVFVVLVGFTSLAVDGGRYYLVKTQLQMTTDAAARYGAGGLVHYEYDSDTGEYLGYSLDQDNARQHVAASIGENPVDGKSLSVDAENIKFYSYDMNQAALTALNPDTGPYAIQVTLSDVVPLMFGRIIGISEIKASATATAVVNPAFSKSETIPAYWNPWLAGLAGQDILANVGNPHNNPDWAGGARTYGRSDGKPITVAPSEVTGIPLIPGTSLQFNSIKGTSQNDPSGDLFNPDGDTGWVVSNSEWDGHPGRAELGKSNVHAPINSVIGVFLGPDSPEGRQPPGDLYFDTKEKRNFTVLRPELRQVFFIGDGKTDQGDPQQFIIPEGATRLYIGNMDGYEWNNNHGQRTTTVIRPEKIFLVKNDLIVTTPPDAGDTGDTGNANGGNSGDNGGGYSDGGNGAGGQDDGGSNGGNNGGGRNDNNNHGGGRNDNDNNGNNHNGGGNNHNGGGNNHNSGGNNHHGGH